MQVQCKVETTYTLELSDKEYAALGQTLMSVSFAENSFADNSFAETLFNELECEYEGGYDLTGVDLIGSSDDDFSW